MYSLPLRNGPCCNPMISSMGHLGLELFKSRHGHQLGRCQEPVPQVEQPQGPGVARRGWKKLLGGETSTFGCPGTELIPL